MSLSTAKAKLDAQAGDPATGYISKQDHKDSYDELVADTALTGATTAQDLTVNGRDVDNLIAGPASATDNALVRFDGTGGKTAQNSGIVVDDSNNVTGMGTLASGAVTSSGAVQAAAGSGFVVGSSGPIMRSGTGSPEGAVTAPVGSIWFQTDSTVGVTHWRKSSGTGNTGWVVMEGDTGRRDITALLATDATRTMSVAPILRRIGPMVSFSAAWSNTGTPFRLLLLTLPTGFRPAATLYVNTPYDVAATSAYRNMGITASGNLSYGGPANSSVFEYQASWLTSQDWPSSLPGSAA